MPHETELITLFAVGLVLAFAGGFIASRLRLPPLVGYLAAGMIIGPFTPGYVADIELAAQLAELGVILLMFGVGLHFSFGDLLAVRRIAVPGALAQITTATLIGAGLAYIVGWSLSAGLVFGLALSVASTVVLLRALDERNLLDTSDGRIAVGWLVVEDLAMVLALVLLPVLAMSLPDGQSGSTAAPLSVSAIAWNIAWTLGQVALFVAVMLVFGRRVIPWLLAQVARIGSRELFTLAVLAAALGIAYGSAELFGVSFALGAFFAGVVLSESDFSHQAAADSLPFQDAFAVLFFVAVGMLFDPAVLVEKTLAVLVVLAIIVIGKSLAAFAIVLIMRYPVSTALTVSASLAQIGEFSFILAGLGMQLGLLPSEGQDLILAGALLSIALNPLVFKGAALCNSWLERNPHMAAKLERKGNAPPVLEPEDSGTLRGHAVIVGYGRVGNRIGEALLAQHIPIVVIEQNRRRVEALRGHGIKAVYGDATLESVMKAAGIDKARLLVQAAPAGYKARRILQTARAENPSIDTLVRSQSEAEIDGLRAEGVGMAIMAEHELAQAMVQYSLRSMGVEVPEQPTGKPSMDSYAVTTGVHAPELRPGRNPADKHPYDEDETGK